MVICWSRVRKLPSAFVRSNRCCCHIISQLPTLSMLVQRCECQNHVIFSARPTAGSAMRNSHQIGGSHPSMFGAAGNGGGVAASTCSSAALTPPALRAST